MSPKPEKTYDEISELLSQIKEAAKLDTRISLLEEKNEQFKENYVKETDIHKMISAKIKSFEAEQEKDEKKGIQWGDIIQQLAITGICCLLTYFLIRGASA